MRMAIKAVVAFSVATSGAFVLAGGSNAAPAPWHAGPLAGSPIKHVVVIYQENHSFNDLLGRLCVAEQNRCLGTTEGVVSDGTHVQLAAEGDVPPDVGHKAIDQSLAINGGRMNGWDRVWNCNANLHYKCMIQVGPGAVPTLWSLADAYAMSDMTFESGSTASWGSHIQLVAATLDGFVGDQPFHSVPGTGCNSGGEAYWSKLPGGTLKLVPSCIPNINGKGPYRASPVAYVPTIMDSLDAAGRSWHIYAPGKKNSGYGWAICPTFYECLGGPQARKIRHPHDFARDAAAGNLPNLSVVIPYFNDSQHPGYSLIRGDNWIAENVAAVMNGPDWDSTAIFITYDDCGCFYDPVAPPNGEGIREPMIIVSPYSRAGFVDHTTANHASLLAFTEHLFGLAPLNAEDANAYDFADAFNFAQRPLARIPLPLHTVPRSSVLYIAQHPPDQNDPT
jgi:phospholipase C